MSTAGDFDEVHVISDLHLGGEKGREMFRSEPRLAGWIDRVRESPAKRVALVLAGDVVDFISVYRKGTYFCPSDAVRQLDALFGPDTLAMPDTPVARLGLLRDALKRFVKSSDRTLVVVIGNHDVELAIPMVRERLRELLCGDGLAARARLVFAVDGQGWRCAVGGRVVYCVHGNEADWANANDHEGMRVVAAAIERGEQNLGRGESALVKKHWKRNFGTGLVVDVLNEARRRAPFVDLLKPEGEPLADIVQALLPDEFSERIGSLVAEGARGLLFRYAPRAVRVARAVTSTGTLGGAVDDADTVKTQRPPQTVPQSQPRGTLPAREVERMEALLRDGYTPEDLAVDGTLGVTELAKITAMRLFGVDPTRALLQSLAKWEELNSYRAIERGDEVIDAYDPHLGPEVAVFIAGHTHAPRAIERERCLYFNSGTWIDLLRIDDLVAEANRAGSLDDFAAKIERLTSGRREDLDAFIDRARVGTAVTVRSDVAGGALQVSATLHTTTADALIGTVLKAFTMTAVGGSK